MFSHGFVECVRIRRPCVQLLRAQVSTVTARRGAAAEFQNARVAELDRATLEVLDEWAISTVYQD